MAATKGGLFFLECIISETCTNSQDNLRQQWLFRQVVTSRRNPQMCWCAHCVPAQKTGNIHTYAQEVSVHAFSSRRRFGVEIERARRRRETKTRPTLQRAKQRNYNSKEESSLLPPNNIFNSFAALPFLFLRPPENLLVHYPG